MPTPSEPQPTLASPATPTHLDSGSTLADRYRIITILGRGGMGEVYRADDLTLGVSVALKFLPPSLAQDPLRLEHFRSEVRLARQISHPNVCRVYDIGEASGRVFLSMEYVDGEDLAGLLRRIGRLPSDKAVQIARQLSFGLAAAHEQGIIHRDLKPANIMLDGRGQVRIMDFGIAGLSSDFASSAKSGIIIGTPGYMAPEQLAGAEVSKRSDIYSLGVLLYELFTGRPVFTATAIEELRQQQSDSTNLTRPSRFVADLDPAVERIILQCLEPDPKNRPPSAMSVAAALPGGDPLAAALAAGETPSPELIAASGATEALTPTQAWGRAALAAAMLALVVLLTASWTLVSQVKPAKRPAVLEDRAIEIIRALGYPDPPPGSSADSARGMGFRMGLLTSFARDTTIKGRIEYLRSRPGAYEFWYRRSPTPLRSVSNDGTVAYQLPFPSQAGEILLRTDSSGRLETFLALPPRTRSPNPPELPDTAIKRVFELAEFDQSRFTPATPTLRSFIPTESVQSWTGSLAEAPEIPLRIHIGSIEGKINHFSIQHQFPQPARAEPAPDAKPTWVQQLLASLKPVIDYGSATIMLAILLSTGFLAWKNLRTGRGDRTTTVRITIAMFVFVVAALVFAGHRLPSARALFFEGEGINPALYAALQFWLFYTALEPYARRVYPHALVSWTRIARGQFSDPLVGRHILIGVMLGAASVLCTTLLTLVLRVTVPDMASIAIFGRTSALVAGPSGVAANTASIFVIAIMVATGSMLPLVLGQLFFKRRWVGYVILIITLAAMNGQGLLANTLDSLIAVAIALIPVLAIRPGGLLALVATHLTIFLGLSLPVGLDWSHWFVAPVWIPASLLGALLFFSARAAAGRDRQR